MSVHTPEEHAILYGQLRAEILSRFFAFGRHFRANHLALTNTLGVLRQSPTSTPPDTDDSVLGCTNRVVVRPSTYQDVRSNPTAQVVGLLDLPPAQQNIERWRVANHDRENPLMYGSHLLVALAVEYVLGRAEALPTLRLAIQSIGQLYKFGQIDGFAGYPIRWDAVTSDQWATRDQAGTGVPWHCCEFLLDENYQHLYCTPFNHPGYVPFDPSEFYAEDPTTPGSYRTYVTNDEWPPRVRSVALHRRWEPSMDELCGLVLSYDVVYALVDDETMRVEIRRQVTNLVVRTKRRSPFVWCLANH